jgi:ABC-type transport system involved in multi-copper enzyme maturation permease subunit
MYFRICWYTKRYRLIVYLTLAMVLTVLGCLPEALESRGGHWVLADMTAFRVARIWNAGTENTLALLLVIMLFAAADLGALAMGEDTKRRELDFLLTRPRRRSYFIWTSWLAGVGELIPLLVLPGLTSILVMFYMTHTMLAGPLVQMAMVIFVMAAGMFALVYMLATLTGSATNGFQIAGFVIFLYAGINYARNEVWFDPDYRPKYFGAFDWLESPHQFFPYANLVLLIAASLALPLLTQAGFKRKDL